MADVTTPAQLGPVLRDHSAVAEPRATRRPTVVIVGAGLGGRRAERRLALLTVVVVGGGPTGVEMAGALSELIRLVLVKDYPRLNIKDVRVLLLEATDRLLASLPDRLREAAAETLWRKHVEVRFG